jgi:hypothetical protein
MDGHGRLALAWQMLYAAIVRNAVERWSCSGKILTLAPQGKAGTLLQVRRRSRTLNKKQALDMLAEVVIPWVTEVCDFLHVDLRILTLFFLVTLPLPILWALRWLWRTLARLHAMDNPECEAYREEVEHGRMERFGCIRHPPPKAHAPGR